MRRAIVVPLVPRTPGGSSPDSPVTSPEALRRHPQWLHSPVHDLAMALVWVPFAVAAHLVADEPDALRWLVASTLLLSFAHQPLTLWLAYGDAGQRRAHHALFAWAPAATVVVVGVASSVRPDVVALAAGAWNLAHTIRQRYGVSRLYGRLSGLDCGSDNRLLWSWLLLAVLVAAARTDLGAAARHVGLGERNTTSIDAVASARAALVLLLPVAGMIALVLTARASRDEWRRSAHSPARLAYLGSTALLLTVLAVEPVTGFVAYVGGHAAEYLLVARWRIDRAAERATKGDRVGALARRIGSGGSLVVYAVVVIALIAGLRTVEGSDLAVVVVLTLGALHFIYDGVIWRTPRPAEVGRHR
jgi:hypothetical protein